MALQSIATYCGSNLPGLYTIEYAPTTWIDADVYRQRLNAHVWASLVSFATGDWLQLPVLDRREQLCTQDQRDTAQGRSYVNQVTGVTPKLRVGVDEQFEQMDDYGYLLRLRDRNGNYWLLGTLETPFYFSVTSTSGGGSNRNQYEITFQSELPERVFGLVL